MSNRNGSQFVGCGPPPVFFSQSATAVCLPHCPTVGRVMGLVMARLDATWCSWSGQEFTVMELSPIIDRGVINLLEQRSGPHACGSRYKHTHGQ